MTRSATFLGADVSSLAALRSSLDSAGIQLNTMCTKETKLIAATAWFGSDAEQFRQSWQGQYAPLMQKVATALAGAATAIGKQIEQQNQASDNGSGTAAAGSTTGSAAVPPGGGSGGAGGGGGYPAAPASGQDAGPDGAPATGHGAPTTAPAQTGGGGAAGGQNSGDPVHVKTPWISQYDGSKVTKAGDTACFRASVVMAKQAGASVMGSDHVIQVATSENRDGSVNVNASKVTEGRGYIDSELAAGRPVVVGVSHKAGYNGNVDHITDHFVVVTGRGMDANGNTYYTFNDPATRHANIGADTRPENRFTIGSDGNLVRDIKSGNNYLTNKDTYVSMVRINKESGR